MPRELEHFDNRLDPTLSSEIKPILYMFDEYQTYDLVVVAPIRKGIATTALKFFNSQYFENNCFCRLILDKKILIERFTPFNYDWCDGYSKKLADTFKEFGGTGINNLLSNEVWINTEYNENGSVDFGNFTTEPIYDLSEKKLVLTIPKSSNVNPIVLTWLRFGGIEYSSNFENNIAWYDKTYFMIIPDEKNEITVTINIENIQPCSLVISGNENLISGVKNQIPYEMLWDNFDIIFNEFLNKCKEIMPYLFKYIDKIEIKAKFKSVRYSVDSRFTTENTQNILGYNGSLVYDNRFTNQSYHVWLLDEYSYRENEITDFYRNTIKIKYRNYPENNNWLNDYPSAPGSNVIFETEFQPEQLEFELEKNHNDQPFSLGSSWNRTTYNLSYDPDFYMEKYDNSYELNNGIYYAVLPFNSFSIIPESAKKSAIIFANNNFWNNQSNPPNDFGDIYVYDLRNVECVRKLDYQWLFSYAYKVENKILFFVFKRDYDWFDEADQIFYTSTITENEIIEYADNYYYNEDLTMPDSVRVKEIHDYLRLLFNPDKHCYDTDGNDAVFTLGDQIDLIAQVLGISFYRNGAIKSVRQRKNLKSGSVIPSGYGSGQFEIHTVGENSNYQDGGINGEERIGIQYDNISNNLIGNIFDPDSYDIENGDYVLCENLLQYFQAFKDDLDKALALQEMSAGLLPSEDGTKICSFEGMGILIAEVAWMLSKMSRDTSQTLISSLITQAVGYELLKATGLPLMAKSFKVKTSESTNSSIVYPAVTGTAPNNLQQFFLLLENIAPILAYVTDILESDLTNLTENGE